MRIIVGDCVEVMAGLPECSVDAVVCDPPYELGFMGAHWDASGVAYQVATWAACLRVLKPGGHLLAFGGSRTYHRMACAVEDAGFEIRDQIMWVYGSGFPKSHDVSKAIDKAAGAEREVVGQRTTGIGTGGGSTPIMGDGNRNITAPATDAARRWSGWGTALKPAHEPIVVARKPLSGTVAENVLRHGTGAVNVDGCRVSAHDGDSTARTRSLVADTAAPFGRGAEMGGNGSPLGRWPANFVHDGSDEVVGLMPETGPSRTAMRGARPRSPAIVGDRAYTENSNEPRGHDDDGGSAARFFYCAKASRAEREAGLDGMEARAFGQSGGAQGRLANGDEKYLQDSIGLNRIKRVRNAHPTVKPIALMRWLVRLVTPPDGTVLDPFLGSGTTAIACALEGFDCIGIEREAEYAEIAEARIKHWQAKPKQTECAFPT